MPRLSAVNCRYFPMAAEVAICLLLVLVSCSVSNLQAQTLTTTTINEMDVELLGICGPPHTEMLDYSQTPSADLGSGIFWTVPVMGSAPGDVAIQKQEWSADAARVDRYARLRIYFFLPEVVA